MRLLIVEDEDDMREALCCGLRKRGYAVDSSGDGAEAVQLCYINRYDLVVLDLNLPGMDGMEVLRHIQSLENHTKVLILSARSELTDKIAGLDSGASDYLTKPFAAKELLARIRSITRRQTETAQSVLGFGNITLDRRTFELKAPGGSVRLANKEYQMLEMLMMNPGALISTERFMEKIWGYNSEAEINVVWVYLSYLRKRLAAIGANVQIKATRNQGYSLEEAG